jgi:tetratricopeptide (TPR) repeat protein
MNIDKATQSALKYFREGNVQEAESLYQEILKAQPNNFEGLYYLGLINYKLENYDLAIQYIKEAIQINPNNTEAHYNLANALRERGCFDEAIICYQKTLKLNPNFDAAYINLGDVLKWRGLIGEAISCYRKAFQLRFDIIEAYSNFGNLCQENGLYDEAIINYQKAIHLTPNLVEVCDNLTTLLQLNGQLDEAATYYKKALYLKSIDIDEFKNKIGKALQNKRLDELIISFQNNSDLSILIVVDAYNRKKVTHLSLAQTQRYKGTHCYLQVYNDHSTEYDNLFLSPYADEVIQLPNKMGSHNLRKYQFRKFLETDFSFLYMVDSDVLHDPKFETVLRVLYEVGDGKLPICLYNSKDHAHKTNIVYHTNGISLRKSAPGISMFFDRKMVEKIVSILDRVDDDHNRYNWDYRALTYLGVPCITPEISFLEHYGGGGIHSSDYEKDRAINPTEYLQYRRKAILGYLTQDTELQIDF